MNRIFRKNRHHLPSEGKAENYLKYAIGEITLVVLGILIALYINELNSKRIEINAANYIYKNIKRQINADKSTISDNLKANQKLSEKYEYGVMLIEKNDRTKIDTLVKIECDLIQYTDGDVSSNIYQNLINSGESKLLKNKTIMEKIQKLEATYMYMNRMEQIHSNAIQNSIGLEILKHIKLVDFSARNPNAIFGIDFQNSFVLTIYLSSRKEEAYKRAIEEIQLITELIDEELK
ncbi:hypothetical protein KH5_12680 [Urechidicola sp. KH5]